jgi:hypothetical protein
MPVPSTEKFFRFLGRLADALSISGVSALWLISATSYEKCPETFGPERLQNFCVSLAISAAARSSRPGAVTIMWLTAECKGKASEYTITDKSLSRSSDRKSVDVAIMAGFIPVCEPRYPTQNSIQNSRTGFQTNVSLPQMYGRSPEGPTKNAGRSKRFPNPARCDNYFSAYVLCAKAVERTDSAERNLLACLEQEGFAVEPK